MIKRFTLPVAAVVVLLGWIGVGVSRADEATDKLIEEIVARSKTNDKRASDLYAMAGLATENPTLQAVLLEKAVEYGLKSSMSPEVRAVLDKSLDTLITIAPKQAETWRATRIELYNSLYRAAKSRDERTKIAYELLDLLLADATAHEQAGRWGPAAIALRQALAFASRLSLPERGGISVRLRLATHRNDAALRVKRYIELVKAGKALPTTRRALVKSLVQDLDTPERAAEFLNEDVEQDYRTHVPLVVPEIDKTPEAACEKLGAWYYGKLSPGALAVNKIAVLDRAAAYYRRFLELHTARDVAALKARTALGKIEKELERLTAGQQPRIRDRLVFYPDKSMKLYEVGRQFSGFPVQETADGRGPFTGKGVYFNQKTGKNVLYEIYSSRPVKEVHFKGAAMVKMTIEILDPKGKPVAAVGPIGGGNKWGQFSVKVPRTVGRHFFLRFYNDVSTWFYINTLTLQR